MSTTDAGTATSNKVGSEVLVASVVFFVMAVVFMVFIYIYVKSRWGPGSAERRARVRQILHGPDAANVETTRRGGLDPEVLRQLPVTLHKKAADAAECAVCLSEIADGDKVRLLPKCKHGFHVACIDVWLASHSTCPLCRDPLGAPAAGAGAPADGAAAELPTNVLFWGTEDRVSTVRREALVIDVPMRAIEEPPASSTPLPASSLMPMTRLSSFKRLFSRERWGAGAGSSHGGDVEQGSASASSTSAATGDLKTPRGSS